MLKFHAYVDGQIVSSQPMRNAYLLGGDGSAMRGAIIYEDGVLVCDKREAGAAALALQYDCGQCGEITVQTCLLPDRDEPYLLSLEIARHRLMVLYNKAEDWGMFDIGSEHPAMKRMEQARKLFIQAICAAPDYPEEADRLGSESLIVAIDGSEQLALAHAELLLEKRRTTGALPQWMLGCGVPLNQNHAHLREGVLANFDFLVLPTPWKDLAPEIGDYHWDAVDDWIQWARTNQLPVIGGPLVSFQPHNVPDWLFIWEHDYETVRDLIYEHVQRVVDRFKDSIDTWTVVSGLHINNHFTVAFDQLMDLTRMTTMLVRKTHPAARIIVEICQPFGEYYSSNQRSIPPLMYADLLVQGGISFDVLGIKLLMGQAVPGQYTRDLMQISNLLDQFSQFGKQVSVVVGAPSEVVTEEMIATAEDGRPVDANCGYWRKAWSPRVQGRWLEAVLQIGLSKPLVESITWHDLVDHAEIEMPLGGLVTEDLKPKMAFRRLASFRKSAILHGSAGRRRSETSADDA